MEIIILFIVTLAFLYLMQDKMNKAETERFREFVIANKSKNLDEYVATIPEPDPVEFVEPEIMEDLSTVDPEILIKALNNQDEGQSN